MTQKLPMDVCGLNVFPKQGLENKIGYVARIEDVDMTGRKVRIRIQNKTDILNGHSALELEAEDFERLMNSYRIKEPDYLVGKSVISVYTRDMGIMLSGLIPLDLDK